MMNKNSTFIAMNEFVKAPVFIVDGSTKFVRFGADNKLPSQLIEYYRTVGLHRAILDKKKKLFLGTGVDVNLSDSIKAEKTIEFLTSINRYENIDSLFDKIATDIVLFSGVYLQIIWDKSGKNIAEIFHVPFEQVRSGKKNEFGIVDTYYVNTSEEKIEQWASYTDTNQAYINEMPAFSTRVNKKQAQILSIHEYEPGFNYYSLPDYIGALKDLNTWASISDFHNANVHNNMQPGLTIMFSGPEPSKEQKDAIVKNIKKKYSNTANAGRPMIFWLETDQELKLEQPEASDVSNMYKLLSDDIKENIIVAHQIPRAVSGLAQPGSLGGTKEMIEGVEIVRSNYIEPKQSFFLNRFNALLGINGLAEVNLTSPSPNLLKYSIEELLKILTVDEVREYLGKSHLGDDAKTEAIEEIIDEAKTLEEKN